MNLRKYQLASLLAAFTAMVFLGGCASKGPEMKTVNYVDLERFMGDWYVIANIPTFLEKGAHNAVETYELNDDGTIATTFVFREDSFDGEEKRYTPKGFVKDTESNALWGMRFIWPIKADYRIVYLDDDYTQTIIGRQKRDFIWIMARTPTIPEADYERLIEYAASIGYDTGKIERVPQSW
jgi:apolipoprotein D and lipocalin family protein